MEMFSWIRQGRVNRKTWTLISLLTLFLLSSFGLPASAALRTEPVVNQIRLDASTLAFRPHRKLRGSKKRTQDRHQSGPQKGRREVKRRDLGWIQRLAPKPRGNAARRNKNSPR